MRPLTALTQYASGEVYDPYGLMIPPEHLRMKGKIKVLILRAGRKVQDEIDDMQKRNSPFIPAKANSYIVSGFYGKSQHKRKIGAKHVEHLVYAIQFYYAPVA